MDCLSLATQQKPLILILDSLDQMKNEHRANGSIQQGKQNYGIVWDLIDKKKKEMNWVPVKLAPFVRVILSTLSAPSESLATRDIHKLSLSVPLLSAQVHYGLLILYNHLLLSVCRTLQQSLEVY